MSLRAPIEPSQAGPPGPPERRAGGGVTGPVLVAVGAAVVAVALAVGLILWTGRDSAETDVAPVTPETAAQAAPPAGPTAADPQAARKAEVLAAYRAAWDAQLAVGRDPKASSDDKRLREHLTGDSLVTLQQAMAKHRQRNAVYVGELKLNPVVAELGGDTATVRDCVDDSIGTVDADTGAVVEPATRLVTTTTTTMKLVGGVWKKANFRDEKVSCTPAAS